MNETTRSRILVDGTLAISAGTTALALYAPQPINTAADVALVPMSVGAAIVFTRAAIQALQAAVITRQVNRYRDHVYAIAEDFTTDRHDSELLESNAAPLIAYLAAGHSRRDVQLRMVSLEEQASYEDRQGYQRHDNPALFVSEAKLNYDFAVPVARQVLKQARAAGEIA